ncbi:hypothetical protein TNCV_1481221 [Trichonephila clavipes]|nr:hypothetical protein TNCV_1481221 [Trichonephila clavipes]
MKQKLLDIRAEKERSSEKNARFSSGLHGSTAADSVRSEWPLWHAAKSNAVFARRRIEMKQKLLDIRAEKERSSEKQRERSGDRAGHSIRSNRDPPDAPLNNPSSVRSCIIIHQNEVVTSSSSIWADIWIKGLIPISKTSYGSPWNTCRSVWPPSEIPAQTRIPPPL